jgi:two-component system response regulator PrrA
MRIDCGSPRVLVMDDDADVLASLERGLRLSGFDVATAKDGAEALRSATHTRPDAIVVDINLPVLDGVRAVTALRAMDKEVPVCVLSASPAATSSPEAITVGELEVDIRQRCARVNGVGLDLTRREFELLAVLAEHTPAVLSRAQLLDLVWGNSHFAADTGVVDVFIAYLRRKLEADRAPWLLHTLPGVGFVLRAQ